MGETFIFGGKFITFWWEIFISSPTPNYLPGCSVQWREEPLHCCCLLSVWSGGDPHQEPGDDHHHQEPGGDHHHQERGGDPHHLEKEVQLFHQLDLFLEFPLHP